MTEKRFIIDSIGVFHDNHNALHDLEVVDLLNTLHEENEKLKSLLECSREEANDYCEELMEKDEFIRLYKKQNEQLREALKNSYINEIYENGKYGHYGIF